MKKIAVIGQGYVGLPVAVEFGKCRPTVGFDIDSERIKELKSGFDRTKECTKAQLESSTNLFFLPTWLIFQIRKYMLLQFLLQLIKIIIPILLH